VRLTVTTRDGRTFKKEMLYSPGSPDNPLPAEQIVRKFETLAAHALAPADVRAVVDMALHLDQLEDVSRLMAVLARARPLA
jgi:2-methylcitrate dehydratase PrpD